MGFCFINKLELPTLRAGLGEGSSLNLAGLVEEGDSQNELLDGHLVIVCHLGIYWMKWKRL